MLPEIIKEYNLDETIVMFLDSVLTDEQLKTILKCLKAFSKYEYFNYEQDVHGLISISGVTDYNEYPNFIYDLFYKHIKVLLNYIGIMLNEEDIEVNYTTVNILTEILVTLNKLTTLDENDYDSILSILGNDMDSLSIFIHIIEKYSTLTDTVIHTYVEDVTNSMLETIGTLAKKELYRNEDENTVEEAFTNINKLLKLKSGYVPLGAKLLTTNPSIDNELEILVKNHYQDVSTKDIEKTAIDIASLVIISNKNKENPIEIYANYFEQLVFEEEVFMFYKNIMLSYETMEE